jgi:hypothetical protein
MVFSSGLFSNLEDLLPNARAMTVPVESRGKRDRIRASSAAAPGDSTKRGRAAYQFRPSGFREIFSF